ncbi:peptidase A22B, signal peptide peptidase [Fistulina hepatica ATCC 64428]|uniref:Peptidase A22B, signal peptide peptidase n=1 Tax=Fistulina hepatica ATCC 64428 TaxID=1128425 RepID=A0A0D7ANE3_9AGAR|nr:peptidase A22B, signal peptide peptidase [Fistulina hepatica ATCC 64428]
MSNDPTELDLVFSYAGLLGLATGSVYAGAYGSLYRRINRKAPSRRERALGTQLTHQVERVTSEDAYIFPVIGSVVLFSLYLVVKFLGTEWINFLMSIYFSVTGIASVWKTLISLTRYIVGPASWRQFETLTLRLTKGSKEQFKVSLKTTSVALLPVSFIPSVLFSFFKAYKILYIPASNVLSLSFAHAAFSLLKLDSFRTGSILLAGLFLYDIWWVFGTEVMVKVATSLEVPIKLLWPKSIVLSSTNGFTMLGLGDVVIPGVFVALALRYDYARFPESPRPPTPYFNAALFAYAAGLATTMTVMHVFKAAQPALLYLSPACILSFFFTAVTRGELAAALKWSDEPPKKDINGTSEKLD